MKPATKEALRQWVSQFLIILWKNLKLRSKSKVTFILEFLSPILFTLLWVAFMAIYLDTDEPLGMKQISGVSSFVKTNSKLLYAPNTPEVTTIMEKFVADSIGTPPSNSILSFASYDELNNYYLSNSEQVFAGVAFNINTTVEYSISVDNFDMPNTASLFGSGQSATNLYIDKGCIQLQVAIDRAILSVIGGIATTKAISLGEFPGEAPPFRDQWPRTSGFGLAIPIYVLTGLFASSFRMMIDRVSEKEKRIRELLRMGGLRPGTESAAWWVTVTLIAVIPIILTTVILKALEFYYWSELHLVLLLYFATFFSLIAFSQLVSVFVNKAKFAGMLGFLVIIAFSGIGIAITAVKDDIPGGVQTLLCIFSPTGFAIGNNIIFQYEDDKKGINDRNYHDGNPSLSGVVGMICLGTVIYAVLSWYLDCVMPGEYGTAKSPFFCFKKNYWKSLFKHPRGQHAMDDNDDKEIESGDVELVGEGMKGKEAVVMKDVRKEFTGKKQRKVAVDGLSVTLYEDHITAFLGHNGAGKTTTISMLTGLIPPTSGEAFINGWNISSEMDQIRSSLLLGVCPQANVLWDEFSVEEHLKIHAGLKGIDIYDVKDKMDEMIKDLGLEQKRHTKSSALSGGQKRKLQLAISFIGSSKVIFLDEPTSGMDPVTRRSVWDFLNKYKAGKAIILTTHFMDEADILGDRIVMISHGKVRCAGSSLYLKARFGVGYLLTMVKASNCNPETLDSLITTNVPEATLLSDFGAELSYRLPGKEISNFSALFEEIDSSQDSLGIESYGISLTTLEEVFLRIGLEEKQKLEAEKKEKEKEIEQTAVDIIHTADPPSQALNNRPKTASSSSSSSLFKKQLLALLIKRLKSSPRDLRSFLFIFLIPLLLIAVAVVLGKVLPLDPGWFTQHTNVLYYNLINSYSRMAAQSEVHSSLLNTYDNYYGINNASLLVEVPSSTQMKDFLNSASYFARAVSKDTPLIVDNVLQLDYEVWFNKSFKHSAPAALSIISVNAMLRNLTNNERGISVVNRPFSHVLTAGELALSSANPNNVAYFAMLVVVAFSMTLAGLTMPLAQERALNIKRLMVVSGASKLAYWISAFIWDSIIFLVLIIISMIVFAIVDLEGFEGERWGVAFFLFILYIPAGLGLSYVYTLRIKKASSAVAQVFAFHAIPGLLILVFYVYVSITTAFEPTDAKHKIHKAYARIMCIISPTSNLGYIVLSLFNFVPPFERNGGSYLQFNVLGFSALMLVVHAISWWALLLFLEYRSSLKRKESYKSNIYHEDSPPVEDKDVVNERIRVADNNDDVIIVRGMRKEYTDTKKVTKVAVANLSLGIPLGQCFGLLGMNGAGKSTTLGVLSADVEPTAGEIFINGFNLLTDPRDALRYFGWCPQFDALIDTLTGREQLTLYARIKGMEESIIAETVNAFLEVLDMEYLADRLAGGYSGGNKRKLSLAIAMIANPPIVFLDEPSTGMDPLSKRLMWRVITQLGKDKAILVTTHYMDECEALCSRIGIMNDGRLVCIGSSQHLKSRFATGYTLQVKAKPGQAQVLQDHITSTFPSAQLVDSHDDMLAFQLPSTIDAGDAENANAGDAHENDAGDAGKRKRGCIASVFAALTRMDEYTDDFAVSQTTLEQVFLKLAR